MGGILATYRSHGKWAEYLRNLQAHGWSISSAEARELTLALHRAFGGSFRGASQLRLMQLTQALDLSILNECPSFLDSALNTTRRERKRKGKKTSHPTGPKGPVGLSQTPPCEGGFRFMEFISMEAEAQLGLRSAERA